MSPSVSATDRSTSAILQEINDALLSFAVVKIVFSKVQFLNFALLKSEPKKLQYLKLQFSKFVFLHKASSNKMLLNSTLVKTDDL